MNKGGGSQTKTSTEKMTLPGWLTDAQKNLIGTGQDLVAPYLNIPAMRTAGFTPDQEGAFDLSRVMTQQAFDSPVNAGIVGAPQFSHAGFAQSPNAVQTRAAQQSPGEVAQHMNPYLQNALDPALRNMRREKDRTGAEIGARAAAGGAFGGSREAIQRGQLDRNYADSTAQMVSQLMAQGYDRATAIAQANTQMRQQAGLQNSTQSNQVNLQNAQMRQQAELQNANSANNMSLATALQMPMLQSNMADADQRRKMQSLQMLLGTGTAQQQLAQSNLNTPWDTLKILQGFVPMNQTDYTKTSTSTSSGGGSGGMGGLGALLSIGGSLFGSDEKMKTDIQKMGKDKETGVDMYSYRYKGDPKTYPKVVGPMAGDVEKKMPGSTQMVGNRRAVRADALKKILG